MTKPMKLTPMMQQYFEIKERYKEEILFFRLGDFYEMFFDDAIKASKILEIKLTGRECGGEEKAPMCGIPYHSANGYISRLVDCGLKVAICEQVEDVSEAKGIVRRDVVKIVTKGTISDTKVIIEDKNNFIASVFQSKNKKEFGLSFVDVSTGEFYATTLNTFNENLVFDELSKYKPTEILVSSNIDFIKQLNQQYELNCEVVDFETLTIENAKSVLETQFKVHNLNGFGIQDEDSLIISASMILKYLKHTQKVELNHITKVNKYNVQNYLVIDKASRRNLELTETMLNKTKKGSLLEVIDDTKTAFGARHLRQVLEQPFVDKNKIDKRLNNVEYFYNDYETRFEIREVLKKMYDIERILGRLVLNSASVVDLVFLGTSLELLPEIQRLLSKSPENIRNIMSTFDNLSDVASMLRSAIIYDDETKTNADDIINRGFNVKLDELKTIRDDSESVLKSIEERIKEETGIKNLKIKYNKQIGYFFEVTNSYLNLVPDYFIERSMLVGGKRFITQELQELEGTILSASDKIVKIENEILRAVKEKVKEQAERIKFVVMLVSEIDLIQSFASVSEKNRYVKPEILENDELIIEEGRHPVIEQNVSDFVPNNSYMNIRDDRMHLITGPNMAGKSTYMRQVALITIMAQIGCYVPAKSAKIAPVDKIFTRVGASDDLASGQSTFMLEMNEVANILNNATSNSLVILDEIGRGTSTYDGLSIAWSVLEYIAEPSFIGAKTLFATHYHELTELEGKVKGVNNYCVTIKEVGDDVVFLHKIERGYIDHSYGIHVAKIAGLPKNVIERSFKILQHLENNTKKPKKAKTDEDVTYKRKLKANEKQLVLEDIDNL